MHNTALKTSVCLVCCCCSFNGLLQVINLIPGHGKQSNERHVFWHCQNHGVQELRRSQPQTESKNERYFDSWKKGFSIVTWATCYVIIQKTVVNSRTQGCLYVNETFVLRRRSNCRACWNSWAILLANDQSASSSYSWWKRHPHRTDELWPWLQPDRDVSDPSKLKSKPTLTDSS